jgi:hypothetical protein
MRKTIGIGRGMSTGHIGLVTGEDEVGIRRVIDGD